MNELFNDLQKMQHDEVTPVPEEEVGWIDSPVVVVTPNEENKKKEVVELVNPGTAPQGNTEKNQELPPVELIDSAIIPQKNTEENQEEILTEWFETAVLPQEEATMTLPSFDLPVTTETNGLFYHSLFPEETRSLMPPRPFTQVPYGLKEGPGVGLSLFGEHTEPNQFDLFSNNTSMIDVRRSEPSILQMVRDDKDREEKERIRRIAEEKERRRLEAAMKAEEAKKKQGPLPVTTVKKPSLGLKPRSLMLKKGK